MQECLKHVKQGNNTHRHVQQRGHSAGGWNETFYRVILLLCWTKLLFRGDWWGFFRPSKHKNTNS